MALIPKGPYRDMVLVWNSDQRVIAEWPLGSGILTRFQAYAIIDPSDTPANNIRYRNFLLPMSQTGLPLDPAADEDIFCSGHAWSQWGDLVVAAGTHYYQVGGQYFSGGKRTFVWNPRLAVADWPFASSLPFYDPALFFGLWNEGPMLQVARWYPTVTMTHNISRATASDPLAPHRQRAVVCGGTESSPTPTPSSPLEARNSYEALVINAEASSGSSGLVADEQVGSVRTWVGSGTPGGPIGVDWPDEYPRMHLLSTAELALTGYATRWATVDHNAGPGVWTKAAGQPSGTYSSNWQHPRNDGSTVLFPNFGGTLDTLVRIGGSTSHSGLTTPTMEWLPGGSTDWQPGPDMTETLGVPGIEGGRTQINTVILPTGGLLVLGGLNVSPDLNPPYTLIERPVYMPLLFENGEWTKFEGNSQSSRRTYHSTAVLRGDGSVFLGGGDDRDYDYEVFYPPYFSKVADRPVNLTWLTVPFLDVRYDAHVLDYGAQYQVHCDPLPLGVAMEKAVLIAPGSVTHHSDMHQRYVEMKAEVSNSNEIQFTCPDMDTVAPRGIYMLFFVTNSGAVSHALWVMFQ